MNGIPQHVELRTNPLLLTDVYKLGHMTQYAPGCDFVYSHLMARSTKTFPRTVFFGLQYYLRRYLTMKLEPWMADDFFKYYAQVLRQPCPDAVKEKIRRLVNYGRIPLKIMAVPEGTILPARNVLMTISNTLPEFYWVVGFFESLLLKIWYTNTVATCSNAYRQLVLKHWRECVDEEVRPWMGFAVHDFGYRGACSEESSGISGIAHLVNFFGSDTVPAAPYAEAYYDAVDAVEPVMMSVPASEHSVMCSYGRTDEFKAFEHMLDEYPSGHVSIVSDTYNVYNVLTDFASRLKDRIMAREGQVVFRPDSGDPELVVCGDPAAEADSPERLGCIRLLEKTFGSTVNSKGFKVLDPHVRLIYGDGMYLARYARILETLRDMGYSPENLVIGVGGILRNHTRDTSGYAIKATVVRVNDEVREIEKDPITDPNKKSLKGFMRLYRDAGGNFITCDKVSMRDAFDASYLNAVFEDGVITYNNTLGDIRQRVRGFDR